MKKLLFVLLLILLSIPIIAQVIEPPVGWLDLFAGIDKWLGSLAGIAAVTVFLAAAVNTLLKTKGFMKQLVAWLIAIILLVVGKLVNMGFMAEFSWLNTIIYGVAAGFLSNSIFDLPLILSILKALGIEEK